MTKVIIYPGTFDPITRGHIDIIERAATLFSTVVIGVATNPNKIPLFSHTQRIDLTQQVLKGLSNVKVLGFDCLLSEFAEAQNTHLILRGLRAVSDFEFEFQLASMNRHMQHSLETIFLTPAERFSFISSTLVKEVAKFGGDVSEFVDEIVVKALQEKFKQ